MQASISYLIILLGIVLGIALDGIIGGVVGGVGFFLLHRVYTLSKRLADVDERLRLLEPSSEESPPAPAESAAPIPAPSAAVSCPAPDTSSAQTSHVAPMPATASVTPSPTEPAADPIVALNATLQSLLPALSALSLAKPSTEMPSQPTTVNISVPQVILPEPIAIHDAALNLIDKTAIAEAVEAAASIEHVLLNALHNIMPPTTEQTLVSAPIKADDAPAQAIQAHSEPINPAPIPDIANDLAHLRNELTTLMGDISAERARHTQEPAQTSEHAPLADAKTMQELLLELKRLTAQLPPSPPAQP